MPCGWEGNRRSGVALAMRHSLQWFIHLWAHGVRKGNEHTPRGVRHRCRKTFFIVFFYFDHDFTSFIVFYLFFKRFLFLKNVGKVQSGKQINKKHFQNNSNEIQWVHK